MRPYSVDLRARVVFRRLLFHQPYDVVARDFSVSSRTVRRYVGRYAAGYGLLPRRDAPAGRRRKFARDGMQVRALRAKACGERVQCLVSRGGGTRSAAPSSPVCVRRALLPHTRAVPARAARKPAGLAPRPARLGDADVHGRARRAVHSAPSRPSHGLHLQARKRCSMPGPRGSAILTIRPSLRPRTSPTPHDSCPSRPQSATRS